MQVPSGNGKPTPVSKSWYVDDSALMQAGKRAVDALNRMVNETGLMYYFLGLVDAPPLDYPQLISIISI